MKFRAIAVLATALLLATSCGVLGSLGSSATSNAASGLASVLTGTQSGTNAGSALLGLFSQYKKDNNSVDLSNVNNILQLASLINNVKGLKDNSSSTSYLADYAAGLITGSQNLVNKNNSTDVIGNLVNLSGLNLNSITKAASSLATSASTAATTATNTAVDKINTGSSQVTSALNTLSSIFSLVK